MESGFTADATRESLGARWLTAAAPGQDVQIVLQKPETAIHGEERAKRLAERNSQGTTWVLSTDDIHATYAPWNLRGVQFTDPPKEVPWSVLHNLAKLLIPLG